MNIDNDTYFSALKWMNDVTETIEERDALAIINGFSQAQQGTFEGSYAYIAEWLKCSKRTVIRTMTSLEEKKLVIKEQIVMSGVTFNRYKVNKEYIKELLKQLEGGSDKLTPPVTNETKTQEVGSDKLTLGVKSCHGGSDKLSPNIIDDIIDDISSPKVEDNVTTQDESFVVTPTIKEKKEKGIEKKKDIAIAERLKREEKFKAELEPYKESNGGRYDDLMVDEFFNYWSEPNKSGSKMKFELQATFEINRRLVTWSSKSYNNGNRNSQGWSGTGGSRRVQGVGYSGTQRHPTDIELARQSYSLITELANSIPDCDF